VRYKLEDRKLGKNSNSERAAKSIKKYGNVKKVRLPYQKVRQELEYQTGCKAVTIDEGVGRKYNDP
jgi:hypothetical protein